MQCGTILMRTFNSYNVTNLLMRNSLPAQILIYCSYKLSKFKMAAKIAVFYQNF